MKHVTREDVKAAEDELKRARAAYDEAASAAYARQSDMDAAGVGGPIGRLKRTDDPTVTAWLAAVSERSDRDSDLEHAYWVASAMRYQHLVYLARDVAVAVMDKCAHLADKPCRYKRVKSAVSQACEGIEDARVVLYDSGELIVYLSYERYSDGLTLYPSRCDASSGEELFKPSFLSRYLDGMLSHVLNADEVRALVDDLEDKMTDVCDKLRSAHAVARDLIASYRVVGLGEVVESAMRRAAV